MVRKYNIDKSQSFIIGDTTTDVQMGKNAGIKTVLVQTGQAGKMVSMMFVQTWRLKIYLMQ